MTGFPRAFSAVTDTVNGWPVVALAGAVSFRSFTIGAPNRKAFRRFAVVCWMRASGWIPVL